MMFRTPVAITVGAFVGQLAWVLLGHGNPALLGLFVLLGCGLGFGAVRLMKLEPVASPPKKAPTPTLSPKPARLEAPSSRWTSMVRAIPDVLMRIDNDNQVVDLHSPEGAEGMRLVVWATEEFSRTLRAQLTGVVQAARRNGFALADLSSDLGGPKRIEARAVADSPNEVLLMLRDASDRVELENRLLEVERERVMAESRAALAEADRLAALGTLAAGVAHEINNPITYVASNLTFTLQELSSGTPDMPEVLAALKEAQQGTKRVKEIVGDMKGLSRRDDPKGQDPFDVVAAAESAVNLARSLVKSKTQLELTSVDVPQVIGSESRLCQVMVNLLINASQAMPNRPSTLNMVKVRVNRDAHGKVEIAVEDNGAGMSEEVQRRVFDPFFTTKPKGVGTGLGLSISRSLVEAMGGTISIASQVGVGTTITLKLPPAPDENAPVAGPKSAVAA